VTGFIDPVLYSVISLIDLDLNTIITSIHPDLYVIIRFLFNDCRDHSGSNIIVTLGISPLLLAIKQYHQLGRGT
jgi:hypothetical protein